MNVGNSAMHFPQRRTVSIGSTVAGQATGTYWLLFIYGFVLFFCPKARLWFSPPVYLIDLLSLLFLASCLRYAGSTERLRSKIGFAAIPAVVIFLLALLPTSISEANRIGLKESVYLLIRYSLHATACISIPLLVNSRSRFGSLMAGILCGSVLSALVGILNSLPMTGIFIRDTIFQIQILTPPNNKFATRLVYLEQEGSVRGSTLVGGANIAAAFLAIGCTMLVIFVADRKILRGSLFDSRPLRILAMVAVPVMLAAIGLTYSRSGYLALAIMFAFVMYSNRAYFMRVMLPWIILGGIVVSVFGLSNMIYDREFISNKSSLEHGTVRARILSYTRPTEKLIEDPTFLFRGDGRAIKKAEDKNRVESLLDLRDHEMHSLYAAAVFYRGFLSFLVILVFVLMVARHIAHHFRYCQRYGQNLAFASCGAVMMLGLLPFIGFTHFFVTSVHGHLLLFFVLGLAIACVNISRAEAMSARATPMSP